MSKTTKKVAEVVKISQEVAFERDFCKMFVDLAEGDISTAIIFEKGYKFEATLENAASYPVFTNQKDEPVNFCFPSDEPAAPASAPAKGEVVVEEKVNEYEFENFQVAIREKFLKLYLNLSPKEEFEFIFQYFIGNCAAYYETRFKDVISAGMLYTNGDNVACFVAIPRFENISILESACNTLINCYVQAIALEKCEFKEIEEGKELDPIVATEDMFLASDREMQLNIVEPDEDDVQYFKNLNNFSFDDTLNQEEKLREEQLAAETIVLSTLNMTRYHLKELPPKTKEVADMLLYAVTHFDASFERNFTEDDKITKDMIFDALYVLQTDFPELYMVLSDGIIADIELCENSTSYVANVTLGKEPTGDERTAMRDLEREAFKKIEDIVRDHVKKQAFEQTPLGWERAAVQWMEQNLSIVNPKGNIVAKNYGYEYRTEEEYANDMRFYREQLERCKNNPKEVEPVGEPKVNVKLENYDLKDNAEVKVEGFAPLPDMEEEPTFEGDKNAKTNKEALRVDFYKKKLIRNLGFNSPFSPIYNRCGSCFANVSFFCMICSFLEIEAVPVMCICSQDQNVTHFLKAKIGEDWVCLDIHSCIRKMDYREFNLDDPSFNLTHEPIGDEIDDSKFFYPRCATMKLSYYSIMNTLITSMNLDQAVELLSRAETRALEDSRTRTLPFCFMCTADEQHKVLGQLLQVDEQVGREKERTVHCHKYKVIEGSEDPVIGPAGVQVNGYCVVEFYFQTWSGLDVDATI